MLINDVSNPQNRTELKIMKINPDKLLQCQNTNNTSSSLQENAILNNFCTRILVGNMVHKYAKGWGGIRRNTPGMDILTTGKETVPQILDVSC